MSHLKELERIIDMETYKVIQTQIAENDITQIARYITNELCNRDALCQSTKIFVLTFVESSCDYDKI